mmetsp:Transcript_58170/g.71112  ORF Transcript_58170/g.71112 Transcript_58170/m.71112 type:complete len:335 (+) Transcript_58170:27-1031(+)
MSGKGLIGFFLSFIQKILGFLVELPFIGKYIDLLLLFMVTLIRCGSGSTVGINLDICNKPKHTLILFEYEGCPFCKKVRETLTVLNLDAIIYPCPRVTFKKYGVIKGSRFRPLVKQFGGKAQFPYLIDPNCDKNGDLKDNNNDNDINNDINGNIDINSYNDCFKSYESDVINKHLWKTYGYNAKPPTGYNLGRIPYFSKISLSIAALLRCLPQNGMLKCESKKPKKLLTLYSNEASPFCKKVREVLSSLEIPYKLINIGYGSKQKRNEFRKKYSSFISKMRKKAGLIIVPLLIDPNTNTTMIESDDIKRYLLKQYKMGDFNKNDINQYSTKKDE